MTAIRDVLGHDPDEPICDDCCKALAARPLTASVTVSVLACCLCGNQRPCTAIRDWHWPAARPAPMETKRKPWAQTDDYSELEALIGRRP